MMKRKRLKRAGKQTLTRKKRKRRKIKRKRKLKMTNKTRKSLTPILSKARKFKMTTLQRKLMKFSDVLELGMHQLNTNSQIIKCKVMAPTRYVSIRFQE
jgi:hypothetical protein